MVKFLKAEGSQWYVKLTLESDQIVQSFVLDCSDNVGIDTASGASVDGAWSEVTSEGKTLHFTPNAGKIFTVSANITDGGAFTVFGVVVAEAAPITETNGGTSDNDIADTDIKEALGIQSISYY